MIWAVLFATALGIGWGAAYRFGGRAEQDTIFVLTFVWLGTVGANLATDFSSPYYFYAPLDVAAIYWLYKIQEKNWQWIVAGLFTVMLLTHILFWSSVGGLFDVSPRAYQDTLAVSGYLQILSVVLASGQRWRAGRGTVGNIGRWALANNWVPLRHRHYAQDEGSA